jgi:hypothetical protein
MPTFFWVTFALPFVLKHIRSSVIIHRGIARVHKFGPFVYAEVRSNVDTKRKLHNDGLFLSCLLVIAVKRVKQTALTFGI